METTFISNDKIKQFIDRIEGDLYVPHKKEDYFQWQKYPSDYSFDGYRTILPPKFLFYSPQEVLVNKKVTKRTVMGIKGCDLRAILFLRKVFKEGDSIDPFFREDNFIISADCSEAGENCFCTLLGDKPYAEQGFDLNISTLDDGFIFEVGSERGKTLIEKNKEFFIDTSSEQLSLRKKMRDKVTKEIKGKKIKLDKKNLSSDAIMDEIKKCVSCSACTNICPSCFCFLLGEKKKLEKVRFWDSCQLPGYARVAGGANPRKELDKRFVHRLQCKFEYSPVRFGSIGCFGCGRCTSSCYGGIDFQKTLSKLG